MQAIPREARAMTRLLLLVCCLLLALSGSALPLAAQLASVEAIPVDHKEPITIRVLDGRDGRPIPNLRLALRAGYTENDIARRFWREEAMTNADGEARLPSTLANFPFLDAILARARLCQSSADGAVYKIGLIRSEGWLAPNHCGVVAIENQPGVLTLFATQRGKPETSSAPEPSTIGQPLNFSPASSGAPTGPRAGQPPEPNEIESLLGHDR
jgi:hypothetical protein